MNETAKETADAPRSRGRAIALGLLLATALGVFAGTRWHEVFERWLPAHAHDDVSGVAPSESPQLWTCGMHPQVIQDRPGLCPICHMELTPLETNGATKAASGERTIKYWWDPMMSPPYISDRPGKSPMGMDLVPVYEDEPANDNVITIDPAVVQNMGVKTAIVTEDKLERTV